MELTSPTFENNGQFPRQYTCDGEDINPPLEISGVPEAAKSLALVMDDPDAPAGLWTHWTVWNIAPQTTVIAANSAAAGAELGLTSAGASGYHGPCPPSKTHRYVFHLYALDTILELPARTDADGLKEAMAGHILAQADLSGKYSR